MSGKVSHHNIKKKKEIFPIFFIISYILTWYDIMMYGVI